MSQPKHPIQPVVMQRGVARFKENKIVSYLLDNGGIDLNQIAMLDFSQEDREQFAQLIGYSVSGSGDLSYMSDETHAAASQAVEALLAEALPAQSTSPDHPWIQRIFNEMKQAKNEKVLLPNYEKANVWLAIHTDKKRVRIEISAALEGGTQSKHNWKDTASPDYWRDAASPWFDSPAEAVQALATELKEGRIQLWDLKDDKK